ncbi:MAG: YidC/Oxa1 family membrane protein insertase, partial [Clostridia bacterium]|nr:YidC/Oxa1 family membrane protein insertase [Clostridia bacterium]
IEAFSGMWDEDAFSSLSQAVSKGLPNFDMFGLNLANTPDFRAKGADLWLLFVPVLTFVVYFASMKISRKLNPPPMTQDANAGCSNNVMDFMMPLMSVWITFSVPAAIGVYWIFKSVITTIKQFILAKAMPLPTFTEEDYKAAEKEILGKGNNKKVKKSENAGKVRSLHHIDDDDDFEDEKPAPKKNPDQTQKSAPKKNSAIESAKLKDDDRHADVQENEVEEALEDTQDENTEENN